MTSHLRRLHSDPRRHTAARRLGEAIARTRHIPLYRSSYAQILTTGANAVLGLLFWVLAARLYPPEVVGLGVGGISALQLVGSVGWVGLQYTLMRYVPVAGAHRRRLVAVVYSTGIAAALIAAVIFTFAFAHTLHVSFIAARPLGAIAFWIGAAIWVVASIQDAVLLGIRRPFLVPVENTAFGLIKLILLAALSGVHDPWALLGVWIAGTVVPAVAVNTLLFGRLLAGEPSGAELPSSGGIARFSAGHTAVALTAWLPDFLVPLLVLRDLDQAANAYYYAAWTVGFAARLLAMNIANALTVEGAYAEDSIGDLARSVIRLCLTVLLPVMGILLVAAPLILQVFGARYAHAAAPVLRLFALSLAPYTVATLVVALDRVRERFGAALAITSVGTVTTIGLDLVLIPADGIKGAGLGWLIGQGAAAIVAVVTLIPAARVAPRRRGHA